MPNSSAMTDRRDHLLPSGRATAPPSQTRVVLQVLLMVLAVATGVWLLYRLQRVVFLLILTTFSFICLSWESRAQAPGCCCRK